MANQYTTGELREVPGQYTTWGPHRIPRTQTLSQTPSGDPCCAPFCVRIIATCEGKNLMVTTGRVRLTNATVYIRPKLCLYPHSIRRPVSCFLWRSNVRWKLWRRGWTGRLMCTFDLPRRFRRILRRNTTAHRVLAGSSVQIIATLSNTYATKYNVIVH